MFNKFIDDRLKFLNKSHLSNQKGVTIIMLVIAIIMMIIIVSFAVFNAPKSTNEAKIAKVYANLKTIKDACENALYFIEINPSEYDEYYFFGNNIQYKINSNEISNINLSEMATTFGLTSGDDFSSRTYIIKPAETDEEKRILKNLELKSIDSTYIVDLENDKYYILDGVSRDDGTTLYEYKDILLSYEMLTD